MRTKWGHICLSVVLLSLMIVQGCWWGSGSSAPGQLFVPDMGNSRVLVYDAYPSTNGQAAIAVLGQSGFAGGNPNFDSATPLTATTADSMVFPLGLAMDSAGKLYISDAGNCRILQFSPPFTTGKAANFALGQASGQTNLTTSNCAAGNAGLYGPAGMAFDSNGNLWVADEGNSRVLMYPKANLAAGGTATVVIGTANCTTTSGLCFPTGVAFDSSGNLWIADSDNNRVLMFPAGNLVTGATATFVLGQTATTSGSDCNQSSIVTPPTANTLCGPSRIAFDGAGNLWVADAGNNRVLMYPKGNLATNGAAATLELGQPAGAGAFTTNTANNGGIGPSTLFLPISVGFDSSGRLIVGDGLNNRILFFSPPFSNGMNATLVLGQPGFTTGDPNYPAAPGTPPTPGTPSATNLFILPVG